MKGEMNITTLFFSLLIVTSVVTGLVIFASDVVVTYYPVTAAGNVSNFSQMQSLSEMQNLTGDIDASIQGASESNNPLIAAGYAIKGGWDAFLLFFKVPGIFNTMYSDLSQATPILIIPSWFKILLVTSVMFIVIIAALKFIRGGDAGL
jgi:hypothetical protein